MMVFHAQSTEVPVNREVSLDRRMKMKTTTFAAALSFLISLASTSPYLYNPYYKYLGYTPNYFNQFSYGTNTQSYQPTIQPTYSQIPYEDNSINSFLNPTNLPGTLNVLAEVPTSISTRFTSVPMVVVSKETVNMVNKAQIMGASKQQPTLVVRVQNNRLMQCTPAVKIVLEEPLVVYSLRSSIVFPSDVSIRFGNFRIPIRVGAVIAPIAQDTYVSAETPVYLKVVYAVSTRPLNVDYVNNVKDVVVTPDTDAVVVESEPPINLPPKNITILNFPETIGEPSVSVDEEDEELVNRNPPIVLAPAGIVQSSQPQAIVEPFHNSKESPVLTALREEALKRRY